MGKIITSLKWRCRILYKGVLCILERIRNPGAAYLVLTPAHENLGDHAIAEAELQLLAQYGVKVIELSGIELLRRKALGLLHLMNGRLILVHGGGFLGTLWFSAEELLRDIIRKNPKSRIIAFPNTVYYENSTEGKAEQQRSVEIYNAHKKLTLYVRERKSFELASLLYRDVRLMPDMVMYLDYSKPHFERSGCILCLRSDIEKTLTEAQEQSIMFQIHSMFGENYTHRDMLAKTAISPSMRTNALSEQIDAFKHAEVVVTDRLHGMVFCAITGTPCIVVNSKSHKVLGCYSWLKHLEYIRFCDDVNQISELYSSMPKGIFDYDNDFLLPYYTTLMEEIQKASRGK